LNLEREPLGDGGLADAGVADVDGVVLAAAAEDLDGARDFRFAADERVDLAFGGACDEVGGEGFERVARRLLRFVVFALGLVGEAAARLALDLRDAVREIVEDVETRDALLLEQIDGVRVGRQDEGGEDVAAVNLFLSRPFGLKQSVFDDALEGGRVLGERVGGGGGALQFLFEELFQLLRQRLGVAAAVADDLGRRALVQQRVEEVFERHVLVPSFDRLHRGEIQSLL
jgi:hypothetical protein